MKSPGWIRRQFKKKPRIYIMPTRMGGYLNGLIFLMFLLSVGYNNNLLLIFTLSLFALNLMWVIQTHFYLHALKLDSVSVKDGHVGENIFMHIHWKKTPEGPSKWDMRLENDDQSFPVKILSHSRDSSSGCIAFPSRGLWRFQHLFIKTEMPFGLYQAWVYFSVDIKAHGYPAKLKNSPTPRIFQSLIEGDSSTLQKGPHDVWNLGPYEGGESRKISWKHYARSGELVIKEGEELKKPEVHFKVREIIPDKEALLSVLATQMVYCLRNETSFSLETSEKRIPPGFGEKHLHDCLKVLALC